jgi:hypothetical protein
LAEIQSWNALTIFERYEKLWVLWSFSRKNVVDFPRMNQKANMWVMMIIHAQNPLTSLNKNFSWSGCIWFMRSLISEYLSKSALQCAYGHFHFSSFSICKRIPIRPASCNCIGE